MECFAWTPKFTNFYALTLTFTLTRHFPPTYHVRDADIFVCELADFAGNNSKSDLLRRLLRRLEQALQCTMGKQADQRLYLGRCSGMHIWKKIMMIVSRMLSTWNVIVSRICHKMLRNPSVAFIHAHHAGSLGIMYLHAETNTEEGSARLNIRS